MNPQDRPIGPKEPQFTDEALNKKFSYSFTRKQLIILFNTVSPIQLPVGDMRVPVLAEILDEIKRTALQSITPDDYIKIEDTNHIETN